MFNVKNEIIYLSEEVSSRDIDGLSNRIEREREKEKDISWSFFRQDKAISKIGLSLSSGAFDTNAQSGKWGDKRGSGGEGGWKRVPAGAERRTDTKHKSQALCEISPSPGWLASNLLCPRICHRGKWTLGETDHQTTIARDWFSFSSSKSKEKQSHLLTITLLLRYCKVIDLSSCKRNK